MNNSTESSGERISAVADGQLQGAELAQVMADLLSDPHAVQRWHAYHLVGDVMRSPELAPGCSDAAFLARLERRLLQEPGRPVFPPAEAAPAHSVVLVDELMPPGAGLLSANRQVFRWKMLASVMGAVLVGVIGTGLWNLPTVQTVAQVSIPLLPEATTSLSVVDGAEAGVMVRDARLDELIAAHKQLGGHSALQVPAGFLRNATFEGPAR
jgi:sigma-E factor negative regulatory protein RseA